MAEDKENVTQKKDLNEMSTEQLIAELICTVANAYFKEYKLPYRVEYEGKDTVMFTLYKSGEKMCNQMGIETVLIKIWRIKSMETHI